MVPIEKFRKAMRLPIEDEEDLPNILLMVIEQWETLTLRPWRRAVDVTEIFAFDTNVNIPREAALKYSMIESVLSVQQKYLTSTTWMDMTFTIGDPTTGSDVWLDTDQRKFAVLRNAKGSFLSQLKVVYTAGVVAEQPDPEPDPVQFVTPEEIQQALIIQGKFMTKRMGLQEIDVTQQSHGKSGGATYMDAKYHPLFETLAEKYRRHV